jgi:tetratricopeptide (TPR) repeat protein
MRLPRPALVILISVGALLALCLIAFGIYNIPAVNDRLYPRVDKFMGDLRSFFNPELDVVPTAAPVANLPTFAPDTPTATLPPTTQPTDHLTANAQQPNQSPTPSPQPPTATNTLVPLIYDLPDIISLKGTRYEPQLYNNCGPSTLTAALVYWGWRGSEPDSLAWYGNGVDVRWQKDIAAVIKPGKGDKNVMPYELTNYAEEYADLQSVIRYGGSIDLIRRFVANGFPVIIERGFREAEHGQVGQGWEGHYSVITGYDNGKRQLLTQDSFKGANYWKDYDSLTYDWRDFNYLYLILYPAERADQVIALLGSDADPTTNLNGALTRAQAEASANTNADDLAFSWFNVGTSLQLLGRNEDATLAFDQARSYGTIPYRMLWYQTYMYKAYFFAKRYQDVIDLATVTLQTPGLEESNYWRGWAYYETGNIDAAVADMRTALDAHPKWDQALAALTQWGVAP